MPKNLKKNSESGFISLNLVLFFSLFLTLYLTISVSIAITEQADRARTLCYEGAADLEAQALRSARKLFHFNKMSKALRLSITATQASIAAAIAALQFEALPPLERTLNALQNSQKNLDQVQKMIIKSAELRLKFLSSDLLLRMNSIDTSKWKFLVKLLSVTHLENYPQFAIQPDTFGGLGPNYEWKLHAEKLLSVSYIWSLFFQTQSDFQSHFSWTNKLQFKCGIQPNLQGDLWTLKTIVDKF